jgi:hypothetical protein
MAPSAYLLPSFTIALPAAGVNQPEACGELVLFKMCFVIGQLF